MESKEQGKQAESIKARIMQFAGDFPDTEGRKRFRTWDELREALNADVESYASLRVSEAVEAALNDLQNKRILLEERQIEEQLKNMPDLMDSYLNELNAAHSGDGSDGWDIIRRRIDFLEAYEKISTQKRYEKDED